LCQSNHQRNSLSEMKIRSAIIDTPFAQLSVYEREETVRSIDFSILGTDSPDVYTPLGEAVANWVENYLNDPLVPIDLPMRLDGTSFQKSVWKVMLEIKTGNTRTYGDVAQQLNSSPRAVGNACRRNPIPLIIPCHRIVAKNGIGGFGGETSGNTVSIKRWLLQHEAEKNNFLLETG